MERINYQSHDQDGVQRVTPFLVRKTLYEKVGFVEYFASTTVWDGAEDKAIWQLYRKITYGGIERVEFAKEGQFCAKWSDRSSNTEYFSVFDPPAAPVTADPIHDAHDGGNLNPNGGATNHDFSIPAGAAFAIKAFYGSSTTMGRWQLQIESATNPGVFTTPHTIFNSAENKNCGRTFDDLEDDLLVRAGATARIIRIRKTNINLVGTTPASLHSTLVGEFV